MMAEMRKTFHEELDELQDEILVMGNLVIRNVTDAVDSLISRKIELAEEVIRRDDEVDNMNLSIEEKGMSMLALQQPVARDLRLIYSVLLITVYLERIGDLALNIATVAKRTGGTTEEEKSLVPLFAKMGDLSCQLVSKSLEAFRKRDIALAEELSTLDEPIDQLYKQFLKELRKVKEEEDYMERFTQLILASRYLERVADNAVNIGERVTYIVTGELG